MVFKVGRLEYYTPALATSNHCKTCKPSIEFERSIETRRLSFSSQFYWQNNNTWVWEAMGCTTKRPRHSKTWIWLQRKSTLWSRKCKDKKPWLARPNNYDPNSSKKAYYLMSGIPSRQEALPLLPMGYAAWSRIVFAQSLYRLRHGWKLTSLLHRSLTHVADWLFVHKSSSETFQENIK